MHFVHLSSIPSLQNQVSTPKRGLLRHGNLLLTLILIPRTTRRWLSWWAPDDREVPCLPIQICILAQRVMSRLVRRRICLPSRLLTSMSSLAPSVPRRPRRRKVQLVSRGAIHCSRRKLRYTHLRLWWRVRCPCTIRRRGSRMLRANTPSL